MTTFITICIGLIILLKTTFCINVPVAFEGYDLMFFWNNSAFDDEAPWNGTDEFVYRIISNDSLGNPREYDIWFMNQENLNLFSSKPWYFMPQYGGFCAIGMCCQLMPDGYWSPTERMGPPSGIYTLLYMYNIIYCI